jgi:gamma-glutamylcyclotransferase (GGCT)/AIG2-like uncharacterized protein YtfP
MAPVFVYGTLRPGQPGFAELGLSSRVDVSGPARVTGTLYDLGDYPAAVLTGTGVIHGELLIPHDEIVLADLDAFEIFDPLDHQQSEYLRVATRCHGTASSIWVYVYNWTLAGFPIIPSGDWLLKRPDMGNHPSLR